MQSIRHLRSLTYKATVDRPSVECPTGPVEDGQKSHLIQIMSNLIDLSVEFHIPLLPELDLAHVKFDI